MATEPIIVTDTDDLQRAFAEHIFGFMLGITRVYADRLAVSLIESLRANCPTPEESVILTWDWREQPDMDEFGRAIHDLFSGHLHKVDADSDQYAIVLSTMALDNADATELYRQRWEDED